MQIKSLLIISTFLMSLFTSTLSNAQVILPSGFNEVLVAPGITGPTTMSMSPDGRFFIAQQNGLLRVVKNDTLLAQPFIALNVNIDGERGLLGVVCDPNFAVNQYIYLCYSVPNGAFNRVSRFTASGDTVVPGSEVVVIDLDTLIAAVVTLILVRMANCTSLQEKTDDLCCHKISIVTWEKFCALIQMELYRPTIHFRDRQKDKEFGPMVCAIHSLFPFNRIQGECFSMMWEK